MLLKKCLQHPVFLILKSSFIGFVDDNVLKFSAALAYYTIFSLPSMLIVIIGLCSVFYGKDAVQGEIFFQIHQFVGNEAALEIQHILQKTTLHHDNFLATITGLATLLLAATGMFGEIQDSINIIWGLKTKPKKGFIKIFLNRLISFSMVLILGFILLVSLLLNAVMDNFFNELKKIFSESFITYLYLLDYIFLFGVIALLFAFIFKALPDAKILWKDVWVGALITTLLFLIGKFLISYYLMHNKSISAYGAAGSLIIILLWVYYSAIILYYGAEFTQAYVKQRGRFIQPNKYAVWIAEEAEAKKIPVTEISNIHK
ncbi:MAG: YihY/virulence factor BrkB family protein [Bacteroidia bacterium]